MSVPFIEAAFKTSLLLAAAAATNALLARRTSAASRHLVWTLAVVGLLVLPILSAALPSWEIAIRVAASKASDRTAIVQPDGQTEPADARGVAMGSPSAAAVVGAASGTPIARSVSWETTLAALYAVGVFVLLIRLAAERRSVQRLARHAADVSDPAWTGLLRECAGRMGVQRPVRLLRSLERNMPMALGTRVPAILIPSVADTWSEDRRRAVLLHELAHVARHDCLTQLMATVACAIYWVHPGVWWLARRLRVERELACDDRVLAAGTEARDYAGHLLELAYTLGGYRAPALAVSMARRRQLEGRMLAVLDAARNRAAPALRSRVAGIALTAALLVPLAAAQTRVVPFDPNRHAAAPIARPSLPSRALEAAQRVEEVRPFDPSKPGTWSVLPASTDGIIRLRLTAGDSQHGFSIPIEQLDGLSPAMLSGAGGPVQFRIRRDAGAFAFEGTFRSRVGAGTYTFAPSESFPSELTKRGLGRPTAAQQYALAMNDIGFTFLDELTTQGYARPDLSELVAAADHGVRLDYLREMGRLGYRLGVLDSLMTQRDHGVTPQFIRELGAYGITGLSPDEILRARDHGVSPEYVRDLLALGYQKLALDTLIQLRDHGVDPEYVRALDALGYQKLPLDALVRLRDHGVDPEYVRALDALGYQKLALDTLVRLRDHGVDPEYVRELGRLGYQKLALDTLVQLRDHGVDPGYVRDLGALGYQKLSLDELTSVRDHGIDAEYIRGLNALGYERLLLDSLIRLRDHGVTPEYVRELKSSGQGRLTVDELIAVRDRGVTPDRIRVFEHILNEHVRALRSALAYLWPK